jgi:hypothetical protein
MKDSHHPACREGAAPFPVHALFVLTLLLAGARTATAQAECPAASPNESFSINHVAAVFTAAHLAHTRTQLGIATQTPSVTRQFVTDPAVCRTNYDRVSAQIPKIWELPSGYTGAQMLAGYTLRSYRIGEYMAVLMLPTANVRGTAPLLIFDRKGRYLGVIQM